MILAIPLYFFLFLYFGFLALFIAFVVINFYHIVASGTMTLASFVITFLTATATIFILFFTHQLLRDTDWQQPVTLFNSAWITNTLPASDF